MYVFLSGVKMQVVCTHTNCAIAAAAAAAFRRGDTNRKPRLVVVATAMDKCPQTVLYSICAPTRVFYVVQSTHIRTRTRTRIYVPQKQHGKNCKNHEYILWATYARVYTNFVFVNTLYMMIVRALFERSLRPHIQRLFTWR